MSKANREKRAPLECFEVERPPIDESLPMRQYNQRMAEDTKDTPLTVVRNGKTYSAVDAFLKRTEGDLAIWSVIYCSKPEDYDVNNKPESAKVLIRKARGRAS